MRPRTLLLTAVVLALALLGCGSDTPAAPGSGSATGSGSAAASGPPLRVGIEFGYLPFEMKTATGEEIGFDVELARKIGEHLGREVVFVSTEWDNIIPALVTGKFDCVISGMSITEKRKRVVDFSDPYYKVGQAVLIQRKDVGKYKTVDDLNKEGLVITTQNATTGHEAAKKRCPNAEIKPYDKQFEAALEVAGGRADGMIFDHPFVAIFAMRNKKTCAALLERFTTEDIGIAVSKKNPELLKQINEALAKLKADKTINALHHKYFVDMPWLSQVPAK